MAYRVRGEQSAPGGTFSGAEKSFKFIRVPRGSIQYNWADIPTGVGGWHFIGLGAVLVSSLKEKEKRAA